MNYRIKDRMILFITILAFIWFVGMTCISNYCVYSLLKEGHKIKLKPIPLILDVMAIGWLTKVIIERFL